MIRRRLSVLASVATLASLSLALAASQKGMSMKLDKLWLQIDKAEKDGLPETAAKAAAELHEKASGGKDWPQATAALVHKVVYATESKDDPLVERIRLLEKERSSLPAEAQPMALTILAEWYWSYQSANAWRFAQRSHTGTKGADFTEWDLQTLYEHVTSLYEKAMENPDALRAVPAQEWKWLVKGQGEGLELRPTLFDFIGFEAFTFLSQARQAFPLSRDSVSFASDSPALAPAEEFLKWNFNGLPEDDIKVRGLRILQSLLRGHSASSPAFLDIDLARLRFARENSADERTGAVFESRLETMARNHPESAVAALAETERARRLMERKRFREAHAIALSVTQKFPKSRADGEARSLLASLTTRFLALEGRSPLAPETENRLSLRFRNLNKVWLRVVPATWTESFRYQQPKNNLARLSTSNPVKTWSEIVDPGNNFEEKSHLISVPALPPGFYELLASANATFDATDNQVQVIRFFVSPLGVNWKVRSSKIEGTVRDASSGEPAAETRVTLWQVYDSQLKPLKHAKSGAQGEFTLALSNEETGRPIVLSVEKSGMRTGMLTASYLYPQREIPNDGRSQALLFSDRALYRPGQEIQFKALLFKREKEKLEVSPQESATVELVDSNGTVVGKQEISTNAFGSASGRFQAPGAGALLGQFELRIQGKARGSQTVRVEEYKKPKFEVRLLPPETELALDREALLQGEAVSYSGVSLADVAVRFKVRRTADIPLWWFWRYAWGGFPEPQTAVEIASGTVRTNSAGRFEIRFPANADPSVPQESSARYRFAVSVEVQDVTGETQNGETTLTLARSSLEPHLTHKELIESNQAPVFKLWATNAAGKNQAPSKALFTVHSLRSPSTPERPATTPPRFWGGLPQPESWQTWENHQEIISRQVNLSSQSEPTSLKPGRLQPGAYRVVLETTDSQGRTARTESHFLVVGDGAFPAKIFSFAKSLSSVVKVGETFEARWGTGFERGRALVEVEKGERLLKRTFTSVGRTQERIQIPVDESMRGGFTVRITFLRQHGFQEHLLWVEVPWDSKELTLSTSSFRSALTPGQKETWTLTLAGKKGAMTAAELVASLYDASLEAIAPLNWPRILPLWPREPMGTPMRSPLEPAPGQQLAQGFRPRWSPGESRPWEYPAFLPRVVAGGHVLNLGGKREMLKSMAISLDAAPGAPASMDSNGMAEAAAAPPTAPMPKEAQAQVQDKASAAPQGNILRKNLAETALFSTSQTFDREGKLHLTFQLPESLTTWKFVALAHTKDMASGEFTATAVASKPLMVEPFLPRFVRTGDRLTLAARITSTADNRKVRSRIRISDALSGSDLTALFLKSASEQTTSVEKGHPHAVAWDLQVPPEQTQPVAIAITASVEGYQDGEEQAIPVLSNRVFLTDSRAFFLRKKGDTPIDFPEYSRGQKETSILNHAFTVEYTPNAAWTVLGALSWLAEYPFECAEQVFHRLYASLLGGHIVTKVPEIEKAFLQWKKNANPLPLERNADLKRAALTETPWLLDAESESDRRQRMARLFDKASLAETQKQTLNRLMNLATGEGAWPWYPGGPANETITLHILAGVARLRQLGLNSGLDISRALAWLDGRFVERQKEAEKSKTQGVASSEAAYWLYIRSQLAGKTSGKTLLAQEFWLKSLVDDAVRLPLLSQAHAGMALHAFGKTAAAQAIVRSLRERSQLSEEFGMRWAELERPSGFWHGSPVETQAALMELFARVANDPKAVDEMKIWLISQKRTQSWSSTTATADAVFALLFRGEQTLLQQEQPKLSLGGKPLQISGQEAGTGYMRKRFSADEMGSALAPLTVTKTTSNPSWGALHWQRFVPLSRVPAQQSGIAVDRTLLVSDPGGRTWHPAKGAVKLGDTLRVRLTITAERNLEFVHLTDLRPSGFEPAQALSGYRSQEGLWFYEISRDTGTDFFIDFLPKGRYVFEYALKAQHTGEFEGGFAQMECLYAPEFRGRSAASERVTIGGKQ